MAQLNKNSFNATTEISFESAGIHKWPGLTVKTEDELTQSITRRAIEQRDLGKSAISEVLGRRNVTSEHFNEDLDQLIREFATDNAKASLGAMSVKKIYEIAKKSWTEVRGNNVAFGYIHKNTNDTNPLWMTAQNADKTHRNDAVFNFSDLVVSYCNFPPDFNQGDVVCIKLPQDRVDGTSTLEFVIVVKTKVTGMFLMLAVGQYTEGQIKSVCPAFGFDIRKEV